MNKPQNALSAIDRVRGDVINVSNAVEEEMGYVKSILSAIELMAETDSHRYKLEIVSLVKCAHWMADNLEGNIDHFGEQILLAVDEVKNV